VSQLHDLDVLLPELLYARYALFWYWTCMTEYHTDLAVWNLMQVSLNSSAGDGWKSSTSLLPLTGIALLAIHTSTFVTSPSGFFWYHRHGHHNVGATPLSLDDIETIRVVHQA
jgi:hypothetical protein